ncbi:hypothetical protein [Vibrio phage vB_VpaM_XM1]|uniref:Uncharacterized protein n=1 Tax=Vibrio phage PVP-XSN TaxID=3056214 RepID=A0AAX3Y4C7_9CAUD|nr:hypothetical protein PVP_XSN000035 [Vibrio phage PVP-XSN]
MIELLMALIMIVVTGTFSDHDIETQSVTETYATREGLNSAHKESTKLWAL